MLQASPFGDSRGLLTRGPRASLGALGGALTPPRLRDPSTKTPPLQSLILLFPRIHQQQLQQHFLLVLLLGVALVLLPLYLLVLLLLVAVPPRLHSRYWWRVLARDYALGCLQFVAAGSDVAGYCFWRAAAGVAQGFPRVGTSPRVSAERERPQDPAAGAAQPPPGPFLLPAYLL